MKSRKTADWSRREFLGSMAMTGAAAALGWYPGMAQAAKEPPPETTTLRIRYWNSACWAPFYLAEPLLRKEGFTDIRYVWGSGTDLVKMFAQGEVDLSPEFSAQGIYNMVTSGGPHVFLSGLHVGCYALVGSKRVRSVTDLKGKTVWAGSEEYGGPHIFFSAIVSYVGLDPRKDITYAWVKKDEAVRLFLEGKIDGFMNFPPGPQELMASGAGHLLVDTNVDKPWSQYFCCMVSAQRDFVQKNPVASKRALRAILTAIDHVARDPEAATRDMLARKIIKAKDEEHINHSLKDIPYHKWREYNPEDTVRFYSLRMRDTGMIRATPQEILKEHTDWRSLSALKKEFAITAW